MKKLAVLGAVLLGTLSAPSNTVLAQGGALFTRAELSRFICSAMSSRDIPRAIRDLQSSLGDARESRSTRNNYFVEEVKRGSAINYVSFRRQGSLSTGIGYSHELRMSQDDSTVWFENLEEARSWLQAAGLLTRTDPELGVWGYAAASETIFSRAERAAEARFDFRVLVSPENKVSIRWVKPEQAQLASGFCSAR